MIRVAINGYGRIGRIAHRVILEKYQAQIQVVAINAGSSTDIKGWANLLKYDTAYGPLDRNIKYQISIKDVILEGAERPIGSQKDSISPADFQNDNYIGSLIINGNIIPVFSQKDPSLLPWKDLNVDVVLECTGKLRTEEKLKGHITAGAKKIVLSAPVKSSPTESKAVPTYIISVNDKDYKGENVISNASCTTNCIAPVAKIMSDHFGVEKAMMTTIHAYTSDQRLQDGGHKDFRRERAASQNIVPTSTGATSATSLVLPEYKNILGGLSLRVPVIVGSLSDFTFLLKKNTTVEEINQIFKNETENPQYRGILQVTEDPIVSSDIIGNPASAIVDLSLTQVVGGNLVKVIAWYDNEYGYANRLLEEVLMVSK